MTVSCRTGLPLLPFIIMQNSKRCFVLLAFCFFFGTINVNAQVDSLKSGSYSLVLYAGGGASYYSSQTGIPAYLETSTQKAEPAATLRLLWHPDHRLSAGVETGWATFYSYQLENTSIPGKLSLTAVPLLAEFSMPVTKQLHAYAGGGIYFLTSKLDYAGNVKSKSRALGWMAAVSYNHQVSRILSATAEIKWLNATETENATLSAQLLLAWTFLEW